MDKPITDQSDKKPNDPKNTAEQLEEIEVTPEMIEAGIKVLEESGALRHSIMSADTALCRQLFSAMWRCRPNGWPRKQSQNI